MAMIDRWRMVELMMRMPMVMVAWHGGMGMPRGAAGMVTWTHGPPVGEPGALRRQLLLEPTQPGLDVTRPANRDGGERDPAGELAQLPLGTLWVELGQDLE